MKRIIGEIVALTRDASSQPTETGIPGLVMIKGDVPPDQLAAVYRPLIGFVVQGSKLLSIGGLEVLLRAPCYFVLPTQVPATARVRPDREGRYLSLGLALDGGAVRRLLRDVPDAPVQSSARLAGCDVGPELGEAWLRLLRLRATPRAIPALAPVYEREILYRVLEGPQGGRLRALGQRSGEIAEAVHSLRTNYDEPLSISGLARKACMGVTTFHRHFKRVTGLSPIQFQKQVRLLEARSLLAFDDHTASSAAYEVGYRSTTQFNREYSRFFGAPPARDAARFRAAAAHLQSTNKGRTRR